MSSPIPTPEAPADAPTSAPKASAADAAPAEQLDAPADALPVITSTPADTPPAPKAKPAKAKPAEPAIDRAAVQKAIEACDFCDDMRPCLAHWEALGQKLDDYEKQFGADALADAQAFAKDGTLPEGVSSKTAQKPAPPPADAPPPAPKASAADKKAMAAIIAKLPRKRGYSYVKLNGTPVKHDRHYPDGYVGLFPDDGREHLAEYLTELSDEEVAALHVAGKLDG